MARKPNTTTEGASGAIRARDREENRVLRQRLGDILVDLGYLTRQQLETVLDASRGKRNPIGRVALQLGFLDEDQLMSALGQQMGYRTVDLSDYPVDPGAAALLSERAARRYFAVPIGFNEGKVVVAVSDPTNVIAVDDIKMLVGAEIEIVVASRAGIEGMIARIRQLDRLAEDLAEIAHDEEESAEQEAADAQAVSEDGAPIVKAINHILSQAAHQEASDVHIEPQQRHVRIRYRLNGVLHDVMKTQRSLHGGLVSRIKVMAEMDIAERRIPQDGRLTFKVDGKPYDIRVVTLPTVHGEEVVLRLLDPSQPLRKLTELGFSKAALNTFSKSFRRPYGAILVTGPTGSGKSTTLYGTLNVVNDPAKKVLTIEDPVEYQLAGVRQIQVNRKAGLTFAGALRSILRADPDIVMVGEIRDPETASIAVDAAMTGHLLLSTMHTNDAASAVKRLVEMGVEPFLVASAVDCVLGQRLARKLCSRCAETYTPTAESLVANGFPWREGEPLPQLKRAVGCTICAKTGYVGRVAVVEVMPMTDRIRELVVEKRPVHDIKTVALEEGMVPMWQDGMDKVRHGVTSLEEILRVVVVD